MVDEFRWSSSKHRHTVSPMEASHLVGERLFVTDWRKVDRSHLDQFHWSVDEVEEMSDMTANSQFPRGDENVDGFMLLSLATSAFFNNYPIGALGLVSWNYGLNRVRFPETVYLENRIRMSVQLSELVQKNVGWLLTNHVVLEIEGRQQPAMVADFLVMMTAVDADISGKAL